MSKRGVLYGVGVGPGDPQLLTLRAVDVLGKVQVVFAAASTKNSYSTAMHIARPHIGPGAQVLDLRFPMSRDTDELEQAWKQNAVTVTDQLQAGRDCAFITLGDPSLFSTFGYLVREVNALIPGADIRKVSGITAAQRAAEKTGLPLAASEQSCAYISGIESEAQLAARLSGLENAVIFKCYRNMPAIKRALVAAGRADDATFVTRMDMPGEQVIDAFEDFPDAPHYFSLIVVAADQT